MHLLFRTTFLALLFFVAAPSAAQISETEYAERREALSEIMGRGAVFAFGAVEPVLSKFGYDQLPSFDYLTGFKEANAAFVLVNDGMQMHGTLFTLPVSIRTQFYDGFPESREEVAERTGLGVRDLSEMRAYVDSLAAAGFPLFDIRDVGSNDAVRRDTLTRGRHFVVDFLERHAGRTIGSMYSSVWALRARKSAAEVDLLRLAVAITDSAHHAALASIRPGMYEYEIQGLIEGTFRRLGADGRAFGSIVGSGKNSTILHYRGGDRRMEEGDLVLMDIGAQVMGYDADVTRTLPVSGRYTAEQRAIYDLVLEAQRAAEVASVPGGFASAARDAAVRVRLEGLARLGLIQHPDSTYDPMWPEDCRRVRTACSQGNLFMIHGISHGIGLEVHDASQFGNSGRFAAGDVFTIEPGIYINAAALDILPDTPRNRAFVEAVRETVQRYDGIGVRIEDDYLMTAAGPMRLSVDSLRDPDEIEAAMSAARGEGMRRLNGSRE